MSSKEKHSNRSKRSSHESKAGMYAMNHNSNMKTMTRKKIKEAKSGN